MSATLDATAISNYFGEAPLVQVPSAPRFPVQEHYLEDVYAMFEKNRDVQTEIFGAVLWERQQLESGSRAAVAAGQPPTGKGSDIHNDLTTTIENMRHGVHGRISKGSDRAVYAVAAALCDRLSLDIMKESTADESNTGSILCFLPGMEHIKLVGRLLENHTNRLQIIQLHSSVPFEEQQPIFEPAEPGKVKVILATNIAESSVTISDAVAIIDCGRVKEMRYDADRRMSVLDTHPASLASSTQRKGRAGRVGPGKCYRLYTRAFEQTLPPRTQPELLRMELQQTCLQTKALLPQEAVVQTLGHAMDPPSQELTTLALRRLEKLGAVEVMDESLQSSQTNSSGWVAEGLTYLGRRLSELPLEPIVGKMLLLGCAFRCVDPIASVAACYGARSPFLTSVAHREATVAKKMNFASEGGDISATITAFSEWENVKKEHGWEACVDMAYTNNMMINSLLAIESVKKQLIQDLSKMGFFSLKEFYEVPWGSEGPNMRSVDASLVSGIRLAGVGSNLAKRERAPLGSNHILHTTTDAKVTVHTGSILNPMWRRRGDWSEWYAYTEKVMEGSQVLLRELEPVRPIEILLFGGNALLAPHDGAGPIQGALDEWILCCGQSRESFNALVQLRNNMHRVFLRRVKWTRQDQYNDEFALEEQVLDTVVDTLA